MSKELRKIEQEADITFWVVDQVFRKLNEVNDEPRSGVPGEELAVKSGPNEVTVRFTIEAATKTVTLKATYAVKDAAGAVVSDVVYGTEYEVVLLSFEEVAE